jgi:8-oxo-dGTP pyrophosphatase MutT (NUDIX family)
VHGLGRAGKNRCPTLPFVRDAHKHQQRCSGDNFRSCPAWIMVGPMEASRTDDRAALALAIAGYRRSWPKESALVDVFLALLDAEGDPFVRERIAGHFTASAWLVGRDGSRVLLTHHRKLGRWLQLGGHADGDRDLARAALREATEESGLAGLSVEPQLFDLDRHWIPEHAGEAAHWHYDVRYVVRAGGDEVFVVGNESHDLAWRDIATLVDDEEADPSLRRMALKWLARLS